MKEITYKHAIKLSEKYGDYIAMLYDRWQDEKEFEDIKDYGSALENKLGFSKGSLTMTKRPFGFKVSHKSKLPGGIIHILCKSVKGGTQIVTKLIP